MRGMSNGKKALRKLLKNKLAVLGMVILLLLVIVAVFAPQVSGTLNVFIKFLLRLGLKHLQEQFLRFL